MYQCPNCGGNIKFDIATQKTACANCNSYFEPYDISKETDAEENTYFDVTEFTCPQCGGKILSTENTAANFALTVVHQLFFLADLRKKNVRDISFRSK